MAKVSCTTCVHYREAPYEAARTGCWYPPNMPQKHGEAFLDQQQLPGDHEAINLRSDCPDHSPRPAPQPWWRRLAEGLLGRSPAARALDGDQSSRLQTT